MIELHRRSSESGMISERSLPKTDPGTPGRGSKYSKKASKPNSSAAIVSALPSGKPDPPPGPPGWKGPTPVMPPELFAAVAVGVGVAVRTFVGVGGTEVLAAVGVTPAVGVGLGLGVGVCVGGGGGVQFHSTETDGTGLPDDVPLKVIVSWAQGRPEIVTGTEESEYNQPLDGFTETEALANQCIGLLGRIFEPLNCTVH